MKNLLIEKKYAPALLEFIDNEVINASKEVEGVIAYGEDFINEKNIYLYECIQLLNKKFSIEEIESKLSLWFPYGIIISPHDFSYEIVKKYILYLSRKYNMDEKELFFNPSLFFQSETSEKTHDLTKEIEYFFKNYKSKNKFFHQIKSQLLNNEIVSISVDEQKLLKSKIIINITEKNKELVEFFLDKEVFSGNSQIYYADKKIFLLEYFLFRSLSCSQSLINKMILQINKENLTEIKTKINSSNLSYLNNFKEMEENFKDNMQLLEKKMILLKFEEKEKERGSGSSSKGVVKI